jgi:hypothetical protein
MHTYESLKAAVDAFADAEGLNWGLATAFEASVGPHAVALHIRPGSPRKYSSLVYCDRATRAQLNAALAKLPADAPVSVYRRNWN